MVQPDSAFQSQDLLLEFAFDGGVEVVLDAVVRSARKELGDLGPPGREASVAFEEHHVFLEGPLVFVDFRVQVVVPPFATLLALSVGKEGSDD